jgi:hypothetical protein
MRVVRTVPFNDFSLAVNAAAGCENLGLGWVIVRGDHCPMVQREHQAIEHQEGEAPTEEEWNNHCPEHDHIQEFILMVIDDRVPSAVADDLVDQIEMFLATDARVAHADTKVVERDVNDPDHHHD